VKQKINNKNLSTEEKLPQASQLITFRSEGRDKYKKWITIIELPTPTVISTVLISLSW
jgi:hypothetical protein